MQELKQLESFMTQKVAYIYSTSIIFARFINTAITRFCAGDWGEISEDDAQLNNEEPLFALGAYVYPLFKDFKIWIKADEDHITVLFPDEY